MNRYLEAFKENFNVLALAAMTSVSAMLLSPVPLLVALVAEAAYLIFFTDTRWYEARLSRRHDQEIQKRRDDLKARVLPLLPLERVRNMGRLEGIRGALNEMGEDERVVREILRKADYLLEKYLQFSLKEVEFVVYLRGVWEKLAPGEVHGNSSWAPDGTGNMWVHEATLRIRSHFQGEMQTIAHLMGDGAADTETLPVMQRRRDVLQRRCEFIDKLGRTLFGIHHQLDLVDETFDLLADRLRTREPGQVLVEVDLVVSQTLALNRLLDDLAPYKTLLRRKQPATRYGLQDTIHIDAFNLDLPEVE